MSAQQPQTTPKPLTGDPKLHKPSDFASGITGTCLCGSIRVRITDSSLFTRPRGHLCHCSNCRKASGSFAASNFAIPSSQVSLTDSQSTLKVYADYDTGSGNPVFRSFCGACGSPIKSETEAASKAGMVVLKMGIFPLIPRPELEGFAAHRQSWESEVEGAVQFETLRGGKRLGE